jgi:hypothetical protein
MSPGVKGQGTNSARLTSVGRIEGARHTVRVRPSATFHDDRICPIIIWKGRASIRTMYRSSLGSPCDLQQKRKQRAEESVKTYVVGTAWRMSVKSSSNGILEVIRSTSYSFFETNPGVSVARNRSKFSLRSGGKNFGSFKTL